MSPSRTRKLRSKNRPRRITGGTTPPMTEEELTEVLTSLDDHGSRVESPTEQDMLDWLDDEVGDDESVAVDSPLDDELEAVLDVPHHTKPRRATCKKLARCRKTPGHPGDCMKAHSIAQHQYARCGRVGWCKKKTGHPGECSKMPKRLRPHDVKKAEWLERYRKRDRTLISAGVKRRKEALTPAQDAQRRKTRREKTDPARARQHMLRYRQKKAATLAAARTPGEIRRRATARLPMLRLRLQEAQEKARTARARHGQKTA